MPVKELKSVKKCFDILSLFRKLDPKLDVDEISEHLTMPRSSVYRYLKTLTDQSILEYDHSTRKYMLGFRILELAHLVYDQSELRKTALPFLKELAERTKETVYLSILEKDRAVCLERVESNFAIRFSVDYGETFPLYASATFRILMAYLSDEQQDLIINKGLSTITDKTITDPNALKSKLRKVREAGFAYSDQELDAGARAVAAPVFNCYGKVVAGLSVAGPVHRFNNQKIEEFVSLVKDYAKKISVRLGFGVDNTQNINYV